VNLFSPELDRSSERDGYRWRGAGVGAQLDAGQVGASLYELEDGQRICPYHFHHQAEEWVVVVAGEPTLRDPDGERTLRPGDVVCFPPGPDGAHHLRGPGTVLLLSTKHSLEVAEYPDSGKIGVRPGKNYLLDSAVDYWEGEE
jgi:uncharacterized cupin superfamily protein